MPGFIKLMRTEQSMELTTSMHAQHLLFVIAFRAKRSNMFSVQGLKQGQALIGDYKNYGMTEQTYRTAKKRLERWGLATFQPTNKGTIATLLNTKVYDINIDTDNEPANGPATDQQRAANEPLTTNKNERMKELKKKDRLFPIPGKVCGEKSCPQPAVYKTKGEYPHYYCKEHMPETVKALYE